MTQRITIILLSIVMIVGCNNPNTHLKKVQKSNVDPTTGNLIAFWLKYRDSEDKPAIVTEPYAVYMEWYNDVKLFYIYDNIHKITCKTTNFDVFLEGLKTLPVGTEIQRFDTCTATRLYDIPRSQSEKLAKTLSDRNLRWATSKVNGQDREIICYCESSGFRYP